MSKVDDNIEKMRIVWTEDNDGQGSNLDADKIDGLEKEELPISNAVQAEITRLDGDISTKPTGSWTFDSSTGTLSITGVPAP